MKCKPARHMALTDFVLGVAFSIMLIPLPWGIQSVPQPEPALPKASRGAKALPSYRLGLPETILGVRIHYEYDRRAFFPASWIEQPVNCNGSQVDLDEARRVVPLIRQFASVYGESTLRQHLTDIYLLRELTCFGTEYGGTNSTSAVYLRVDTAPEGYTGQHLLSILHAEFSSILMREHAFPAAQWQDINPRDFVYPNDPIQQLDDVGITDQPSEDLFCGGFLTRYGAADLEDDFNSYAGAIFVKPEALCQYRIKCKPIADKAWVAIQFYKAVDPAVKVPGCK